MIKQPLNASAFAQTNLQLFNQMQYEGYPPEEIAYMSKVYNFTIPLFSGWFRGNGKTFLAHLIGTASILASLHLAVDVLAAGLLHAVYIQGNFKAKYPGLPHQNSQKYRQQISAIVGQKAESYIFQYTQLTLTYRQKPDEIVSIGDDVSTLSDNERTPLTLLIANELEEYLDLGMQYCSKYLDPNQDFENRIAPLAKLAEALGFDSLKESLLQTVEMSMRADVDPSVKSHNRYSYIVTTPPPKKQFSVANLHASVSAWKNKTKATLKKSLDFL